MNGLDEKKVRRSKNKVERIYERKNIRFHRAMGSERETRRKRSDE